MCESFRNANGVSTSRVVEKLGTNIQLQQKLGPDVDVEQWCRDYVKRKTAEAKANADTRVSIEICPDKRLEIGDGERYFNIGQLFIQKQIDALGIEQICKDISKTHKFEYNLSHIVSDLICCRILEPSSKISSYTYANEHFLRKPTYSSDDLYRALTVLSEHNDEIQAALYKNSDIECKRDSSILYYDCTNFFFEIEEESGLKRYGKSKEHRPNPIVQFGLFTDANGIPLAFDIFDGNKNEQTSLQPLEKRIIKDFELKGSKMIVCTDAGLASTNNRKFNSVENRDFITISPIKKMNKELQEWVLDRGRSLSLEPIKPHENPEVVMRDIKNSCWRCDGGSLDDYFSLDDIDENDPKNFNKIFYKERYIIDDKTKFEQRLIVTYSIKYKKFMQKKHKSDISRAEKLIKQNNKRKLNINKSPEINNIIKASRVTETGEVVDANTVIFTIDADAICNEAKYDGFYAVCTSISIEEKSVRDIIVINKRRWEIEESFRVMKTTLKSRPVFVSTTDHIKAHFLTCYMALLVFRIMEIKLFNASSELYTIDDIIKTLRDMAITTVGAYYSASFKRSKLTDLIQDVFSIGAYLDCEYISPKNIRKFFK